jgi:hypothetical protein
MMGTGVRKIPEPMILPITMENDSNNPKSRRNSVDSEKSSSD